MYDLLSSAHIRSYAFNYIEITDLTEVNNTIIVTQA